MFIESKRLLIRDLKQDDFTALHAYLSDKENVYYMLHDANTEADTLLFLNKVMEENAKVPRTVFEMGVVRTEDGVLIGNCGIYLKDVFSDDGSVVVAKQASLGWIVNKKYQKNGYGTEIAKCLIDVCFEKLQVHRIVANCHSENYASYRVMERSGMRFEGLFKKSRYGIIGGVSQWYDVREYAILDSDYYM